MLNSSRWRLLPGLAALGLDGEAVVVGRPHDIVFEGAAAEWAIPQILGALESGADVDAIVSKTGAAPAHVEQVLDIALAEGIIEPVDERGEDRAKSDVARFVGRVRGFYVGLSSTDQAMQIVTGTAISCVRDTCLAVELRGVLAADGIGRPAADGPESFGPAAAIVVVGMSLDTYDGAQWCTDAGDALRAGARVLPVARCGTELAIGPLLDNEQRFDLETVRGQMRQAVSQPFAPASPALRQDAALLVAARAVTILTRAVPAVGLSVIQVHDLDSWDTDEVLAVPLDPGDESQEATAILSYERMVEPRAYGAFPKPDLAPSERAAWGSGAYLAAQRHPTLPAIALPRTTARSISENPADAPLTYRIAYLLEHTVGRRVTDGHSWAPNGGNLHSTGIYPVLSSQNGTEPYLYDADEHRLIVLRPDGAAVQAAHDHGPHASEYESGLRGGAPAILVLVANVSRIQPKYGSFALKLGHLDAGCVAAQALLLADLLGMSPQLELGSSDAQLSRLLRLTEDRDLVVAQIRLKEERTG